MNNKYLYIFSKGHVAKIKKMDGEIVWETKLSIANIRNATVANLHIDGDKIYIGGNGVLACINEFDGAIIWTNPLKGWGFGYVIFANQNQTDVAAASDAAQAAGVAAVV